jgi:hypothetical protein
MCAEKATALRGEGYRSPEDSLLALLSTRLAWLALTAAAPEARRWDASDGQAVLTLPSSEQEK